MKYTKQERKQIAAAFKRAKRDIANCRHEFICVALEWAEMSGSENAIDVIDDRLCQYDTLNSWVRAHAKASPEVSGETEQMRLYRLRWLDALIKEFSECT